MFAALAALTGLAGPVASLATSINDLKAQRERAATDIERRKIDADIQELEARKAVLVAEAANRAAGAINAVIRAGLAIGPVAYVLKYYLWDKVIGAFAGCASLKKMTPGCETFVTDGLNPEMAAVLTAVIAFYLLYDYKARHKK